MTSWRTVEMRALGVVIACAAVACGGSAAGPKKERPPASVTIADARTDAVPVEVAAVGSVVPFSTVSMQPRVAGPITSVSFKEGQMVQKGAALFDIEPAPYAAALAQAEAVLARDVVQADNADAEAARYTQLVAQKLVSPSDADAKIAGAKAMRATVAADKAAVDNARLNLSYTHVTSPVTGRADKRQVDVGNQVQPNGAPVVVIRQIAPIQVQFTVPQERLLDVQERMRGDGKVAAQPVEVVVTLPDHPEVVEHGVLSFVGAAVDTATGTVSCKADFDNKDEHLWPGAYVQVKLTLGTHKDAVVVPAPAVQTSQQGPFAFVVKDDQTVEMRPVKTGILHDGVIVVEDGIKAGERVVVDGQMALVPGAKVAAKPTVGAPVGAGAVQ